MAPLVGVEKIETPEPGSQREEGDGCRVVWSVTATPDEMAGLMQGIYQQALTPLKEKAEQA